LELNAGTWQPVVDVSRVKNVFCQSGQVSHQYTRDITGEAINDWRKKLRVCVEAKCERFEVL